MNLRDATAATSAATAAYACPFRSCLCIQPCTTFSIQIQILIAHKALRVEIQLF
ncbi:MAG: hypothetical protein EZS28_021371, partial [Streblomastix strix]